MEKTGLIEMLSQGLADELTAKNRINQLPDHTLLQERREKQRTVLATIGEIGDIQQILMAERTILANDLANHANSLGMVSSLKKALSEHDSAIRLFAIVQDPERYKLIDKANQQPKNRVGGVPRDEARQFFRAHSARLLNMDKSRLDETEKKIIDERRRNLRVAEKAYAVLQRQALGLGPEQGKDQSQNKGQNKGMGL